RANRAHQPFPQSEPAQKALTRRKRGVHQTPKSPAAFHFARELFQLPAVKTVGPECSNVCADARTGHNIYLDAVFLQHLDRADVCETLGCARRKRQAEKPATELPGQAPDIFG